MAQQWDDDQLFEELRKALHAAGDVPEWVVRTGEAAWTWRTVDEELALATLVSDVRGTDGLLVRSAQDVERLLELRAGALSLRLTVAGDVLLGQLEPEGAATITVRHADGTTSTRTSDELGCFELPLPLSAFRIACETATGGFVSGLLRL